MTSPLQILIVEDTPNDVELMRRALEKGFPLVEITQVEDRASLEKCLQQKTWDVVLSDFNLVDLNGFEVLAMTQKLAPMTPFIVVSGAIGEEAAAELLRAGAKDFISKLNFSRLVPAVQRELAEIKRIKHFQQIENKLRETERSLKIVVDSVKDHAIFMIDLNRKIISWNAGAARITGYQESEVIGQSIDIFYSREDRDRGLPQFEFHQALNGKSLQTEGWKLHKNGSLFWATGSITALHNEAGVIQGFAQILRDETDKKISQEELEKARTKAEAANAAKSQFLANMSHEIRTPLGIILGFAELIATGEDPETTLAHAQRILKNGKQLSRIIDDVLDVSKIEANCLEIEKVQVSLRETLDDAISILQLKAEVKGIGLRLDVADNVKDTVVTDPTRLRQVLLNIVGNAIKFTSSGEVSIQVSYVDSSEKALSIQVKDTGKGIPEAAVPKLFQAFSQGEASVNRQYGGTGLGLYLSRQLCQALGGNLKLLETREMMGSTFEIIISTQLQELDNSVSPDSKAVFIKSTASDLVERNQSEAPFSGIKALIIDDSPDNCLIFKYFLSLSGVQVECAENGIEGLHKIANSAYDIVFLDLQMPIMDGYEVLSKLRSNGYRKPIVALTAHALESERQKCLNAGFDDHVAKPATRQDLISAVRRSVSRLHRPHLKLKSSFGELKSDM